MDNVYQTYQITVWKIQLQSFTLSHSHSLSCDFKDTLLLCTLGCLGVNISLCPIALLLLYINILIPRIIYALINYKAFLTNHVGHNRKIMQCSLSK